MSSKLAPLLVLLLVVGCKPRGERIIPIEESPSPPLPSAVTGVPPAPPVAIPKSPGVAGSVVGNGRAVPLRHVMVGRSEDPFRDGRYLAVLLLSDRPLNTATLRSDEWDLYGQTLDFEGIGLRVDETGTIQNLVIKHADLPYQTSGARVGDFDWTGDVVKGRLAEHGFFGKDRRPWSYAFAFHATVPPAPPASPAPLANP
jgi:hypothetical protein